MCLCGAVIPKEGPARVSLIELRPSGQGLAWLADWLNDRYGKASCVVIDGRNGVDVLVERIREVWQAKNAVVRPGRPGRDRRREPASPTAVNEAAPDLVRTPDHARMRAP